MHRGLRGNTCVAIRPIVRSGTITAPWRAQPSTGGCLFREDPDLDAREAQLAWRLGVRPALALVPHTDPAARAFDLWQIPGRKSLLHDGERLWLHGERNRELVALSLSPDVQDGAPYAYAVPAGVDPARYRFTLEAALALVQGNDRSEEHTSELQSLMRISYAVFCL